MWIRLGSEIGFAMQELQLARGFKRNCVFFREAQHCRDKKTLIFFFAFLV
jgi:hypothetical protein